MGRAALYDRNTPSVPHSSNILFPQDPGRNRFGTGFLPVVILFLKSESGMNTKFGHPDRVELLHSSAFLHPGMVESGVEPQLRLCAGLGIYLVPAPGWFASRSESIGRTPKVEWTPISRFLAK